MNINTDAFGRLVFATAWIALLPWAPAWSQQDEYPVPAEATRHRGVPEGKIDGPFTFASDVFPGTTRQYWVYVPQQYDPDQAACLLIVQDGLNRAQGWRLPVVLDNLIQQGDIPVQLGLFVTPGEVPAVSSEAQPRFNRSFEYDSMGPRYARFLVDELIPEVSKKYHISSDPNDRAIAGASSGGICAFTAAWERPDQFRRVLSTIGTFVDLRGGNEYPTLIRKFENKPLRVFLQDGSNDLNIYGGDWWIANQAMLSALQFAGYDVHHAWGVGGHNGRHAAAIMPDALKWLWRDYPQPIQPGQPEQRRTNLVIPGEGWQLVSKGHQFTEGPAVNDKGEVFFSDIRAGNIHRIALDGSVHMFVDKSPGVNGLVFGADGYLYAAQGKTNRLVRYSPQGEEEVLLEESPCNDVVVCRNGGYYTDPQNKKVWLVDQDGARVADEGIEFPNGIVTSADQARLYVADTRGRFIYAFEIQDNLTLKHRQRFGYLHLPDDGNDSGADGMTVDTEGRLYVTTRLGVQVLDQLGRVHLILEKPQAGWLSNVVFGGPELNELYATCGDKVYKRKLNAKGAVVWQPPVPQPKPRL